MKPIETTMPTSKPKASRMNLEIEPYPGMKASRTFEGRFVRLVGVPFSNVSRTMPMRNLEKSTLFIRYYLRIVNKEEWKYYLVLRVRLTFLGMMYKRRDGGCS